MLKHLHKVLVSVVRFLKAPFVGSVPKGTRGSILFLVWLYGICGVLSILISIWRFISPSPGYSGVDNLAYGLLFLFFAFLFIRRLRATRVSRYPRLSVVEILLQRRNKKVFAGLGVTVFVLGGVVVGQSILGVQQFGGGVLLLLGLIMLGMVGEVLGLDYRIRKGFYGTNEREVREIIRFILSKRKHIDFTDDGKPKKIMSDTDLAEFVKTIKNNVPEFSAVGV